MQNLFKWIAENPLKASAIAVGIGATLYVATNKNAQRKLGLSGVSRKPTPSQRRRRRISAKKLK